MVFTKNEFALPDEILKKHGFVNYQHPENGGGGYDPGYTHIRRIHDMQYLLYDRHGFITWKRVVERGASGERKKGPRGTDADAYIVIPNPMRTEIDLKKLLESIILRNTTY